jgi:predicted CopG family antitoxin
MAKKKHISPSRIRYEESHPVVAVRVDRDLYDELKAIKESDEKSFGDILKLGLNVQKATATKSYQDGYSKGYADAKKLFDEKSALADQKLKLLEDLQKTSLRQSFHA